MIHDQESAGTRHMRFQSAYPWLILLASLDIMLTWIVLFRGGVEVNFIAAGIIERLGLPGMVIFKFSLVVLIIVICEIVGRRAESVGRRLAHWSIAVTSIPVAMAFVQLLSHR